MNSSRDLLENSAADCFGTPARILPEISLRLHWEFPQKNRHIIPQKNFERVHKKIIRKFFRECHRKSLYNPESNSSKNPSVIRYISSNSARNLTWNLFLEFLHDPLLSFGDSSANSFRGFQKTFPLGFSKNSFRNP